MGFVLQMTVIGIVETKACLWATVSRRNRDSLDFTGGPGE